MRWFFLKNCDGSGGSFNCPFTIFWGTLLRDTLVGQSYGTLLWDTLLGHSCRTLFWDPLVGHSCESLVGNSCGSLLQDTLLGHSSGTLLWALPSSFATPAPPNNTRSHANPSVTATFTSTTTHNLTIPCACHATFRVHTSNAHKVLRLPRNVTSVTPRNFTIPCACQENFHTSKPAQSTAPATKSNNIISCELQRVCTTFGMISTRSEHYTPIHQNRHFS